MLKTLVEHNSKYYAAISALEIRPWGRMYYNTEAPDHIDANHAEGLNSAVRNFDKVLEEIEAFYQGLGLIPRLRFNQFNYSVALQERLKQRGYVIRPSHYKVMLWNNIPLPPEISPGITVENVGPHNEVEALRIFMGERSWGSPETMAEVYARERAHPHILHFLVRRNQVPAAAGLLFFDGGLGKVDNVRTLPNYREQGCAAAIIKHIQAEITGRGGRGLYLMAGEIISGLYAKLGFMDLGRIQEYNVSRPQA